MEQRDQASRQAVATDSAPAALGPYSQAIVAGGFVFCSGTVGIDPQTGQVADGIEAQTEQALASAQAYGVDAQDDFFQGTSNYKVAPTAAQISPARAMP